VLITEFVIGTKPERLSLQIVKGFVHPEYRLPCTVIPELHRLQYPLQDTFR
jgi:hypothetical protein